MPGADHPGAAMTQDEAELIALRALGWVVAQDDLAGTFLTATGAAPADLRARATDPQFLAAVLDFLMQEDSHIIGFCDAAGLDYARPAAARAALPGGHDRHWT